MNNLARDAPRVLEAALGSRAAADRVVSDWGRDWRGRLGQMEEEEEDDDEEDEEDEESKNRRAFEVPTSYMRGHIRGAAGKMRQYYGSLENEEEEKGEKEGRGSELSVRAAVAAVFAKDVELYSRLIRFQENVH